MIFLKTKVPSSPVLAPPYVVQGAGSVAPQRDQSRKKECRNENMGICRAGETEAKEKKCREN
jgi:hypothetical protein